MKNLIKISIVLIAILTSFNLSFAQDGLSTKPIVENANKNAAQLQQLKNKQTQELGDKDIKGAQKTGKIVTERDKKLDDLEKKRLAEIDKVENKINKENAKKAVDPTGESNYGAITDLQALKKIDEKFDSKKKKVNESSTAKLNKLAEKNQKEKANLAKVHTKETDKLVKNQAKSTKKVMDSAQKSTAGNDKFIARDNAALKQKQANERTDATSNQKGKITNIKKDRNDAVRSEEVKHDNNINKATDKWVKTGKDPEYGKINKANDENQKKIIKKADKDLKKADKDFKKTKKEITKKQTKEQKAQQERNAKLKKGKAKPKTKKRRGRG